MVVATHLIKIKGIFNKNIWGHEEKMLNETLKEYVKTKIKFEIDSYYHADLELFEINDDKIEVWVFINALPSSVSRDIIEKWLNDHVNEEGIVATDFEIEEKFNPLSPENNFLVLIP